MIWEEIREFRGQSRTSESKFFSVFSFCLHSAVDSELVRLFFFNHGLAESVVEQRLECIYLHEL
jgi:hypothetical protein